MCLFHSHENRIHELAEVTGRADITGVCSSICVITRLGNLGFFLGILEILIVALSKSTYQSQVSRVQLPVGA